MEREISGATEHIQDTERARQGMNSDEANDLMKAVTDTIK